MVDEISPIKKPRSKQAERVAIAENLREKLKSLTCQDNEELKGIASLTKSDIINFILKSHGDSFSENDLRSLRVTHFDEIKFSHWITAQLKEAQAKGQSVTIKELMEQNQSLYASLRTKSKRAYRRHKSRGVELKEPKVKPQEDTNREMNSVEDSVTEI